MKLTNDEYRAFKKAVDRMNTVADERERNVNAPTPRPGTASFQSRTDAILCTNLLKRVEIECLTPAQRDRLTK